MREYCVVMLLCCFLVMSSGCATVINGPNQKVSISSNPSGATVNIDGESSYKTPTTVNLRRKNDHNLIISKDGYEQEHVLLMHVVSGAVAGNILLGGLVGWGVDAMTGAQYKLVPNTVHVEMKEAEGDVAAKKINFELTPQQKIEQLKSMYEQGILTEEEYEANKKLILQELMPEQETVSDETVEPKAEIEPVPMPDEIATEAAEKAHEVVDETLAAE